MKRLDEISSVGIRMNLIYGSVNACKASLRGDETI